MRARENAAYPGDSRPSLRSCTPNGYPNKSGRPVSFIAPVHGEARWYRPTLKNRIMLFISQCISFIVSSAFLMTVVTWAMLADLTAHLPRFLRRVSPVEPATFPWDDPKYLKEKCTKDVHYYAQNAGEGYDIIDEEVETEDGFHLRVHRVVNPRHKPQPNGRGGYPVLILHGLFQSSGAFITSEERSLAFWLSEHGGYQVFLGNTRGVFNMGHKNISRGDPRFWDWTIRELAMYDLPALVEYVCDATGYDKIAFIGHSQGNGTALLALSEGMRPELGAKLSVVIALAPVVYAGPLTHGFPFNILSRIEWKRWRMFFGILDFIPLMRYSYDWVPAKVFALFGYAMFAYLFSWTDANWLKRRKVKIFRFTPTPVSSASIFWWCGKGGFAQLKCTMDDSLPRWFDENFPPLAIYYGGRDFLVATEPLLERIREKERHVRLVRVERLEMSEHCDFYLAADAVEWCFSSFIEDIEKTRTDDVERGNINTDFNLIDTDNTDTTNAASTSNYRTSI
ncbi:alpha/beta-hydrolase [Fomitiporia mediterranea MF3/22]|uniref:alpha/beta-hydrolase n=1 Tax=Fomitiporia mediterranea (strain MF3/22) TaxID=694068 RepID=UPI0004409937|nr:alpha/beta-hydrolase [Fomitiporia mediterranea MF3/22]EJD00804.1 alpha/beta-hydrolase [Fomitiporia mediterranea MF3/22]